MVFHHWDCNFTPRENGFTFLCQPNNANLIIEENNFPGKRFTPYQKEPQWILALCNYVLCKFANGREYYMHNISFGYKLPKLFFKMCSYKKLYLSTTITRYEGIRIALSTEA